VPGVPEIVGGDGDDALLPARTCTEKAGRVAFFRPSLTAITMFEYVPTPPAEGAPDSCPVLVLKIAHGGMLAMAKTRLRPCESLAAGVNE
jgi:hypothetical protein